MSRLILFLLSIFGISVFSDCFSMEQDEKQFDKSQSHITPLAFLQERSKRLQNEWQSLNAVKSSHFLDGFILTFNEKDKEFLQKVLSESSWEVEAFLDLLKEGNNNVNNLILVGPSGVGKTTLAKAIASCLQQRCIFVQSTALLNEYQHSGCSNIRKIFQEIEEFSKEEKIVLIFDELNRLTDTKNKKGDGLENATSLWLELEKQQHNPNFLFIGTTNDITQLPLPLKDRFLKQMIIKISKIPLSIRITKLEKLIRETPFPKDETCNKQLCKILAEKTNGCSLSKLEAIIFQAQIAYKIDQKLNNKVTCMNARHFQRGLERVDLLEAELEYYKPVLSEQERLHQESLAQQLKLHKESMKQQLTMHNESLQVQEKSLDVQKNNMISTINLAEKQMKQQAVLSQKQLNQQSAIAENQKYQQTLFISQQMQQQERLAAMQKKFQEDIAMQQQTLQTMIHKEQIQNQTQLAKQQMDHQEKMAQKQLSFQDTMNYHQRVLQKELHAENLQQQRDLQNKQILVDADSSFLSGVPIIGPAFQSAIKKSHVVSGRR